MLKYLHTIIFTLLLTSSWVFILLTALPIFAQLVFVRDFNRRIWDVVVYGFPYVMTGAAIFAASLQRRYILLYRLSRIPGHSALPGGHAPTQVKELVSMEYKRMAAISYYSRPQEGSQPGWGRPGSKYDGVYFKRAFLDAVDHLDETARQLLPSLMPLSSSSSLSSHLQPLLLVIPVPEQALQEVDIILPIANFAADDQLTLDEEEEQWPLFDTGKVYGRYGEVEKEIKEKWRGEMTEEEFERGMRSLEEIQGVLDTEKELLDADSGSGSFDSKSYHSARNSYLVSHVNGSFVDVGEEYDEQGYRQHEAIQEDSARRRARAGFYRRGGSERPSEVTGTGRRMEVQEPWPREGQREESVFLR